MSIDRDDGGPTFPFSIADSPSSAFVHELSERQLRDFFAAKAMQGEIAASGDDIGVVQYEPMEVATAAYRMADAMLAARKT